MNILKNMEAIFVATVAVAITSAAMLAPNSTAQAAPELKPMHVVVVSAKRLTLEEKLQSLREERQAMAAQRAVARG